MVVTYSLYHSHFYLSTIPIVKTVIELKMTHQKVKYEMQLAESEAHTKQLHMKQEQEVCKVFL